MSGSLTNPAAAVVTPLSVHTESDRLVMLKEAADHLSKAHRLLSSVAASMSAENTGAAELLSVASSVAYDHRRVDGAERSLALSLQS